jgi:hypothetical protein
MIKQRLVNVRLQKVKAQLRENNLSRGFAIADAIIK